MFLDYRDGPVWAIQQSNSLLFEAGLKGRVRVGFEKIEPELRDYDEEVNKNTINRIVVAPFDTEANFNSFLQITPFLNYKWATKNWIHVSGGYHRLFPRMEINNFYGYHFVESFYSYQNELFYLKFKPSVEWYRGKDNETIMTRTKISGDGSYSVNKNIILGLRLSGEINDYNKNPIDGPENIFLAKFYMKYIFKSYFNIEGYGSGGVFQDNFSYNISSNPISSNGSKVGFGAKISFYPKKWVNFSIGHRQSKFDWTTQNINSQTILKQFEESIVGSLGSTFANVELILKF